MKPAILAAAGLLTVLSPFFTISASGANQAHRSGQTTGYVTPIYLISNETGFNDFRPNVSADGTQVFFERRTNGKSGFYTIQKLDLATGAITQVVTIPSTRVDLCWQRSGKTITNGPIAFTGNDGIYTVPYEGGTPYHLPNSGGMSYPSWYPDCSKLAVANYPKLATTVLASNGDVLIPSLQVNSPVWAGFDSVNQANPNLVAFAGLNRIENNYYNQDLNYTWVVNSAAMPTSVKPMDRRAPSGPSFLQKYQARAGTWSPNGQWFAFESNRICPDVNGLTYAIFLQPSNGQAPAQQVTDCSLNIQHPKWFPPGADSGKLVAAAAKPGTNNPFAIVKLDVSAFLVNHPK